MRATAGPARGLVLATLLSVLFLTFLDTTIVSVTLGDLESDLSAGVIPLQWVINGYALVFASLMLTAGALGDRYSRKWVMFGGIAIFCVGSLICALAGSVGWVIAGRAVMGVGAAACEPGTLSVIRQVFPDRAERARALGAWSAVSGLALALGPVIGGLLVGAGGWHAVFWFNLAVSLVLLVAVYAYVPDSSAPTSARLDVGGFVLGSVGIGALTCAVIFGENHGYSTDWVIALFVLGAAAILALGPVELRHPAPMLDLRFLRKPVVAAALWAAFAVYFGVFAIFFFTALYLDIGLHYSGVGLAGMFGPMAAAIVAGGLAAGRWVGRVGSRLPTVTGCALAIAGIVLARIELAHGNNLAGGVLAAALALAGLGFGITVVPLTSAVLSHIPARHSGMAASATNTARQLGAVAGVAALGSLVNAHLVHAVSVYVSHTPTAFANAVKPQIIHVLETGGSGGVDLSNIPAPFVGAFLSGLQVALLVAVALIGLAGIGAALAREPDVPDEQDAAVEHQLSSPG
jgi:EmrB/QacA subfamily drug resistance transporter